MRRALTVLVILAGVLVVFAVLQKGQVDRRQAPAPTTPSAPPVPPVPTSPPGPDADAPGSAESTPSAAQPTTTAAEDAAVTPPTTPPVKVQAEPLPEIGEGFNHAVFTGDLYEKGLTCGCQE